MIDDEELHLKLKKLENMAASWAREYIRVRQQSDPTYQRSEATKVQILSLSKISEEAKARNVPVFPTGVTDEGKPKCLSDLVVTQAFVVNIFVYRLIELAKDNKYWPKNLLDGFKALFAPRAAVPPHQTQERKFKFQTTHQLRKKLVKDIADSLLGILEIPGEKKYKSLRRKLMNLGYHILDICVDMTRADMEYRFANSNDVRSYDTQRLEEYFDDVYTDSEEDEELKPVYLLVFPACMRPKLETDHNDTSDFVVKKGKVLLREI